MYTIGIIELIKNEIERLKEFWRLFEADQRAEYRYSVKGYEVIALFAEKPNKEIFSRIKEILLGNSHIRQSDALDIKLKKNIKEAV